MLRRALILGVAMLASSAGAQISPVSRVSRVYAWEHMIDLGHNDLGTVSSEQGTTDFGLFDRIVGAGGYTASQRSEIGASFVSITALAYGNPHSTFGYGQAESSMTFVFDTSVPLDYLLEGSTAQFIGMGNVSLTGPGVDILVFSDGTTPVPYSYRGHMDPGRYTLAVMTTSDWSSASAMFTVVPAPGVMGLAGAGLAAVLRRPRR